MKFSSILPFLTRFCKKRRVAALQLDLRRNATRCTLIITDLDGDFKCFLNDFVSFDLWAIAMLPDNIKIGTCFLAGADFYYPIMRLNFGVSGVSLA